MKRETTVKGFGKRLAVLRKAAGLTQKELGEKVGVSNRVIHYYEGETNYPAAHLIEPLAKALNASTDELLGVKEIKKETSPKQAALWKRLRKIEALPQSKQKTLLKTIDTFLKGAEK